GSTVNISGGVFAAPIEIYDGVNLNVTGREFYLSGLPIENLTPGQPLVLTQRNAVLTGVLADGSPFRFLLYEYGYGGRVSSQATLTLNLVPEPATWVICLL